MRTYVMYKANWLTYQHIKSVQMSGPFLNAAKVAMIFKIPLEYVRNCLSYN